MYTQTHRLTLRIALGIAALASIVPAVTLLAATTLAGAQMQPSDETLRDRIAYRLDANPVTKNYDITVKVDLSIAMLTGTVATAAQKAEAERQAKVDGVKRIENDITIDPNIDKTLGDKIKSGLSKTGEKIDDEWVTAKLKWKFHNEELLTNSDIKINTTKNVVTLTGTVKSESGRVRANDVAQMTEGAYRVINNIVVVK